MKLNSNMKKLLLFVALLICAYLVSLAFGKKADQNTSVPGSVEAELTAIAPEELTRNEPASGEDLVVVTEEEPISLTEDEAVAEPVSLTEEEAEAEPEPEEAAEAEESGITVREDGEYSDKDHVALYIHTYGHLPSNYITKKEANALGWPDEGYLKNLAPGKSIGGDYFGNYEGLLPKKKGREYHECDIDFKGKGRNAKRIIYSNDGLIYYTDDHYETFELLYGGDQ